MRTFAYVDGFNLYYRAVKGTKHKWLDLRTLIESLLKPENRLETIRYYTARVSARADAGAPKRQQAYLSALQSIPGLSIHYGHFLPKEIVRPRVDSPPGKPEYVRVHTTEEKGSDVNLASHLIWDGCQGRYDVAVVLSEDTDLVEPIRIVVQELKKPVGLLCPDATVPGGLQRVVSFVRRITPARLAAAQMANPVRLADSRVIHRPQEWA